MTVDHFIGGLEDGLLDLALVLKQGRAKCKTFITNEYFNENETRIQQGQHRKFLAHFGATIHGLHSFPTNSDSSSQRY